MQVTWLSTCQLPWVPTYLIVAKSIILQSFDIKKNCFVFSVDARNRVIRPTSFPSPGSFVVRFRRGNPAASRLLPTFPLPPWCRRCISLRPALKHTFEWYRDFNPLLAVLHHTQHAAPRLPFCLINRPCSIFEHGRTFTRSTFSFDEQSFRLHFSSFFRSSFVLFVFRRYFKIQTPVDWCLPSGPRFPLNRLHVPSCMFL